MNDFELVARKKIALLLGECVMCNYNQNLIQCSRLLETELCSGQARDKIVRKFLVMNEYLRHGWMNRCIAPIHLHLFCLLTVENVAKKAR